MFQFTPYQAYYTHENLATCFFNHALTQDVGFQPYIFYVQQPVEFSQNHILQNALNFPCDSLQKPRNEEQESKISQNVCLIQEQASNKEKKQTLAQNLSEYKSRKHESNKQKFGRNIVSNIFHLIIKFTQRQKKMRRMIEKLIQTNGMTIKINQFYLTLKKKSAKMSAYATMQQMKDFWIGNSNNQHNKNFIKQSECSKIFRIVGKLYLEKYHIPYVYNSNKIKKQSKKLHKNAIRKIYAL